MSCICPPKQIPRLHSDPPGVCADMHKPTTANHIIFYISPLCNIQIPRQRCPTFLFWHLNKTGTTLKCWHWLHDIIPPKSSFLYSKGSDNSSGSRGVAVRLSFSICRLGGLDSFKKNKKTKTTWYLGGLLFSSSRIILEFSYITVQGCRGNGEKIMKNRKWKEPIQRCRSLCFAMGALCKIYLLIISQSMYIFHAKLYCSVLLPRQALERFSFGF